MGKQEKQQAAASKAKKLGFAGAACTIVLCSDEKTANCAKASQMKSSLKYLRRRAKELRRERGIRLTIVPSKCLKICKFGPIAGTFPDGVWYGGCHEEVLEKIIAAQVDGEEPPREKIIAEPSK